ncbi:hypothetical protein DF037_19995 [Burkholderia contaminans]|uniref:Uncharacterized protein n=1 Tax=Burkholderia contaminans TaxID=488447 RepID=A0A3N8QRZ5_9BURK|nr:hypothetical protein DF037_19995 [Burkholderia contaminans]
MNDRVALETRAGQRVPVTGGAGLPADGGGRPVADAAIDGAPAFSDLPSAERSFLRNCTTSRIGGAPNSRLYSRLNCDALS